jgi:hypothetical protein
MAERMDHEAMRRLSELPISGPAATPTLAASGGLEVPGREPHAHDAPSQPQTREPIPGEHDHSAEPSTPAGTVGTTGYGADLPVSDTDPTIDDETKRQVRWEAGGKTK